MGWSGFRRGIPYRGGSSTPPLLAMSPSVVNLSGYTKEQ